MKVTIVGSGHGACAIAAVLAKHGHEVSLVKLGTAVHMENFRFLQKHKKIRLSGIEGEGEFDLCQVTRDPAEVIPRAELVLVYYVSNFHSMVAKWICPYLNEAHIVVLSPGYAGTLLFRKEMLMEGNKSFPLFVEFETLPYSSRIEKPGSVMISSRNVRHPFSTYPGSQAQHIASVLQPILGRCVPRTHLLEVALHNPNLVIHTAGVLLNVALVEHPDKKFALYRDGFSNSVWNLIFKLDQEKMDVLEKLGAPRISYFDEFRLRTFEDTSIDSLEGFRHYAAEAPDGPFTVEHRYITEDVPMGLGLLHSLGQATGVPTPICDSLIHIASALLPHHNFWLEMRTIESLWESSIDSLLKFLSK